MHAHSHSPLSHLNCKNSYQIVWSKIIFWSSSRRERIPSNRIVSREKWCCVGIVFFFFFFVVFTFLLCALLPTQTRNTHFVFILFWVFVLGYTSCTNQATNVNVSIRLYVRRTHRPRRICVSVCVCACLSVCMFSLRAHGLHILNYVCESGKIVVRMDMNVRIWFFVHRSTAHAKARILWRSFFFVFFFSFVAVSLKWTNIGLQKQHVNRTQYCWNDVL